MNKLILYIAVSEDGFIADSEGGVDWLPQGNDPEDVVGFKALMERIGSIVMGSHSYQQIVTFGEWAWLDKKTYVLTSRPLVSELGCIEFTNNSPISLMEKIRNIQADKDIWLLGGAKIAQSFARDNLIDEIVLTIIPTKLEKGIPLSVPLEAFRLSAEKPCMNGIVQRIFTRF